MKWIINLTDSLYLTQKHTFRFRMVSKFSLKTTLSFSTTLSLPSISHLPLYLSPIYTLPLNISLSLSCFSNVKHTLSLFRFIPFSLSLYVSLTSFSLSFSHSLPHIICNYVRVYLHKQNTYPSIRSLHNI